MGQVQFSQNSPVLLPATKPVIPSGSSGNAAADAYLASLANAQGKFLEETASTQQRLTGINDSVRKRQWRYVQIAGWVVFWMVNLVLAQMLPAVLPFVPEAVWTWHMVVVSLFVGYMIMVILLELSTRSVINYDEIEMSNVVDASGIPLTLDQGNASAKKDGYDLSQLLANKTTCGTGTVYDATAGQCVVNTEAADPSSNSVLYNGAYETITRPGTACSGDKPYLDKTQCVAQCPVGMQAVTSDTDTRLNSVSGAITTIYAASGICADVIESFTGSQTDAATTGQASIPASLLLTPLPQAEFQYAAFTGSEGFQQQQQQQQPQQGCHPCATSGEPSVERHRLITPLVYVDDNGLLPYNAV